LGIAVPCWAMSKIDPPSCGSESVWRAIFVLCWVGVL
jgi:hypothetical protein